MGYEIADIQGDALFVQRHLQGSFNNIDKASDETDRALSHSLDTREKLESAIQDVSSYIRTSGEALAAGKNLATTAEEAIKIIDVATLGQDIMPAAQYAAHSSEYSQRADQSRSEAIYHGGKAVSSLNAAADGLAAVLTYSGKGIQAAGQGLRLLGFGYDTLNEKIAEDHANDSVGGISQKFETAIGKSKKYVQDLNTAKNYLVDASSSTPEENEGFESRHDVGDVRFLVERVVTGLGRLRESNHKRVDTFNHLLELVHTKVTERDVQELNSLLGRLNETIKMLTSASEEQKDIPPLIQGALADRQSFLKSL